MEKIIGIEKHAGKFRKIPFHLIFSVGTYCNGGNSCCTPTNPCPKNQGDCDTDNDCKGNLICGKNNCPKNTGHSTYDDCCYNPEGSGGMY